MPRPNRKVRNALAVMKIMTMLHLLPNNERGIRLPVEKRLQGAAPKKMIGPVPEVATQDHVVPTRDGQQIRVRVYRPELRSPTVLYAHGGGWVYGGIPACDHICRRLAHQAKVAVVSVEYRLAPEHTFPGPLNDVEDALGWMFAQGRQGTRLFVGGDSAGGNLAAALALRLRDHGTPLAGQLLIYPAVDLTATRPALLGYRGPGMTPADCQLVARTYLAGADPLNPEASPIHAPSLEGLPPAFVLTVEHGALRDEGRAYAGALRAAGVPVHAVDVPGHVHGSLSIPALYEGIDEIYTAMCQFLADPTS